MTDSGNPPFRHVGIVGLGLIGGSIAAATRAAWPGTTITAFDRPGVLSDARARILIHQPAQRLADLEDADLIVLATPVPEILRQLPEVAGLAGRALITDVGSTKRDVMQAAKAAGVRGFIGGHPVAGAERSGVENARADLFQKRPWLLVPADDAAAGDVDRLEGFVRGLGALPSRVDAPTHDRVLAYVSHLPQLVAVALMNAAAEALGDDALRWSGRAFAEMTRLASSPPEIWRGILETNVDYVTEATETFARQLPIIPADWFEAAFREAAAHRERLLQNRNG